MKQLLTILFVAISFWNANAQRIQFNWAEKPTVHKIENKDFLKESAIVVEEKVQIIYHVDAKNNLEVTRKTHRIIQVLDEKGIESFNKISIPFYPDYPILHLKARTILPNGKVIDLKPENFKDTKNDEGQMSKLFAMEGVEKGAEIEFEVEEKQVEKLYGSYTLQNSIPTIISEFEVITPSHVIFEMKGYNQVEVSKDTVINDQHCLYAVSKNLKGIEEEKMATYYPHFARVDYTLAYNTAQKGKDIRIYTWDEVAKSIYRNNSEFTDKELKLVRKLLEDNKEYGKLSTNEEKENWIENFVKMNYNIENSLDIKDAGTIEFILKNKTSDESGIRNFLAALYHSQGIEFEVGYTTNRYRKPFDYSFQSWDNLQNCIFYFPDTKRYMAPTEPMYRMPFIPPTWAGQPGMFCKAMKLGEVVTASAEKRKIPDIPAEKNSHDHDVVVDFNTDIDTALIQYKNIFTGHSALDVLPSFIYLEGEKRDEAAKQILNMSDKEEKYTDIHFENNRFSILTEGKPFVLSALIHATNIIEKVGNKYLFKIGDLIGKQSEMYSEKDRQFDLEVPNAHQYHRKIVIHIPTGYKVSNLEKLNMNLVQMQNGVEGSKFTSSYVLSGNTLEVNVFETYNFILCPKSEYENYRSVINAAANFNKISILLEKMN